MARPVGNLSINPASGYWGNNFNDQSFAVPESFSTGKDGFEQQTFLGASIRNFSINAGYGDSVSTLSVELVNDEYNKSDERPLGLGDDVYHNGARDRFAPPPVGSPVYFKFGRKKSSVDEAYKSIYDQIYGTNISSNSAAKFDLCFGGILQSYVQNRGPGGNPLYSAQVVDPREILSNVVLILNNYAGTTFNQKNIFNLYGFLEFTPSQTLVDEFSGYTKSILTKTINPDGSYFFDGYDVYSRISDINFIKNDNFRSIPAARSTGLPDKFPITGPGFSRRNNSGMPFYRIRQALYALFRLYGDLPAEYEAAGFGNVINFRGHNYIVDLGGLNNLPNFYFIDYDQINLLDLSLEICDITSSELFVSLLPIIQHPACQRIYNWNVFHATDASKIISGIIRIDSISKSYQPQYGSIKNYIDTLARTGTPVENQDVGFELSNITTDKFITGAQEVDMYYFSSNSDRCNYLVWAAQQGIGSLQDIDATQWRLNTSLNQQILPYYGLLGNNAVTIPKGFGAYQQILLDSSSLYANGVSYNYIATELELRAALISYEKWGEFLLSYNNIYMESTEITDGLEGNIIEQNEAPPGLPNIPIEISANYGVSVPRCLFDSDKGDLYGSDGLPLSASSPPYGYPLYYKRATRFGVQGAGLSDLYSRLNGLLTSLAELAGSSDTSSIQTVFNNIWDDLSSQSNGDLTQLEKDLLRRIEVLKNDPASLRLEDVIGLVQEFEAGLAESFKVLNRLQKEAKENSLKIYNFIRNIAEECLGKKFLVKIPKKTNVFYGYNFNYRSRTITDTNTEEEQEVQTTEYNSGPFGFKPRSSNLLSQFNNTFLNDITRSRQSVQQLITSTSVRSHLFHSYLDNSTNFEIDEVTKYVGALSVNFNPISDLYEFNYVPEPQGGYINFDLLSNINGNNLGVNLGLVPKDLNKFMLSNSRIGAYVRFDNSETLSFEGVDSSSFESQNILSRYAIPSQIQTLDNTRQLPPRSFNGYTTDAELSFIVDQSNNSSQRSSLPQITFMKCEVDERLYMPPKSNRRPVNVHATAVKDIGKIKPPKKEFSCDIAPNGGWKEYRRYYVRHYVPDGSRTQSFQRHTDLFFVRNNLGLIPTSVSELDTNNVYALITLPNRIKPTQDGRFRDGQYQKVSTTAIKHFLAMDVVKVPEFQDPAFINQPPDLSEFTAGVDPTSRSLAIQAYFKTMKNLINFGLPKQLEVASPSPVYPDLVALPLLSRERCYGPWISSRLDIDASVYSNIPGKVEFIKDENLAPWNYAGYQLMNEAGVLQAQFANSLLLQSERGGFVYPGAPSGIFLGKALSNLGPLVTNISVDVSDNGIKTTVKMDLYTSSFGKLQKAKLDNIASISRQKQKLQDERNAFIRNGFGKNQKNIQFNLIYDKIKNTSIRDYSSSTANTTNNQMTHIVVSNTATTEQSETEIPNIFGSTQNVSYTSYQSVGSLQSVNNFYDTASYIPNNIIGSQLYNNTAAMSLSDLYAPISMEYSSNMANVDNINRSSFETFYT